MAFEPVQPNRSAPALDVSTNVPMPTGDDFVGFGKHGELTYDALWANEPGYGVWVMAKFNELVQEGEELDTPPALGDTKIKRLAQWLIAKEKMCEESGPAFEYNDNMEPIEIPSSRSMRERADAWRSEKRPKFYAIAAPEKRVCTSWEECKPYVHGVKGVMYRSFYSKEEAEEYVQNPPARKPRKQAERKTKHGDGDGETADANLPPPKKHKKSSTESEFVDGAGEQSNTSATKAEAKANGKAKAKSKPKSATTPTKPSIANEDELVAGAAEESNTLATDLEAKAKRKSKAKSKPKSAATPTKSDEIIDGVAEELNMSATEPEVKTKGSAKGKSKPKSVTTPTVSPQAVADGAASTIAEASNNHAPKTESGKRKKDEAPVLLGGISDDIMNQADSLGLASSLRNLASRPEVVSLNLPSEKLLQMLQNCDGLVNKAKTLLLQSGL